MTQMRMPSGLPAMAMLAASAPKIVGSSEPKIESPIEASGPMRPVLRPATASLEATPSCSWRARSMPVTMVLKKFEVLKKGEHSACAISFNSGVPSP